SDQSRAARSHSLVDTPVTWHKGAGASCASHGETELVHGLLRREARAITMNTLRRFQLLVELARGGMGIVYLARSVGVGGFSKLHIIKELKPEFADDTTFLSMFVEEARLSARLEHPNIVQTIEVGQDGRRHFMAMEYLKGQSLERISKKCG